MIEYKDGKIQIDAISKKDLESQIEDIKQKIKTEESKEKPDKEKINELKSKWTMRISALKQLEKSGDSLMYKDGKIQIDGNMEDVINISNATEIKDNKVRLMKYAEIEFKKKYTDLQSKMDKETLLSKREAIGREMFKLRNDFTSKMRDIDKNPYN